MPDPVPDPLKFAAERSRVASLGGGRSAPIGAPSSVFISGYRGNEQRSPPSARPALGLGRRSSSPYCCGKPGNGAGASMDTLMRMLNRYDTAWARHRERGTTLTPFRLHPT